jgi:hypothetical protein
MRTLSAPQLRVDQGLQAREREFHDAYEQLRHVADLGQPTSEAHAQGFEVRMIEPFS